MDLFAKREALVKELDAAKKEVARLELKVEILDELIEEDHEVETDKGEDLPVSPEVGELDELL